MMPLSPRERAVLALADEGKAYKEIASELNISVNTVRTYARNILVKTMATCMSHAAFRIGGARIPAAPVPRRRGG